MGHVTLDGIGPRPGLTGTLQGFVEDLAAELGRSVAIDDADMRLVAVSRHYGEGDEDPLRVRSILDRYPGRASVEYAMSAGIALWTEYGRLAARPDLGLLSRVCAPIRSNGLHLGYMWIIDADGSLTAEQLESVQAVADACGALLYRQLTTRDQERETGAQLLRELVGQNVKKRVRSARSIDDLGLWSGDALMAIVLVVNDTEDSARIEISLELAVERVLRALPGVPYLVSVRGHRVSLLLGAALTTSDVTNRVLRPLRSRFHEAAGAGHRLVAGIGPTRPGLAQAYESHQAALLAARGALQIPRLGDTVKADELGYLRVLLQLPLTAIDPHVVLPRWPSLVAKDPEILLRRTMTEFLDRAGNIQDTAEALMVHRTTLYHRIGRVEKLLEIDLRRGDDRFALHLALQLAELTPRP